jgi:hypothetical protein
MQTTGTSRITTARKTALPIVGRASKHDTEEDHEEVDEDA